MVQLARYPRILRPACALFVALVLAGLVNACGGSASNPAAPTPPGQPPTTPPTPRPPATGPVTIAGAGDIALCGPDMVNAEATSKLLDGMGASTIFTLGDNALMSGKPEEFACFDSAWGRHKARIRPSLGNHDVEAANGAAYYGYFGAAAGPSGLGYYSYDAGAWHVVVLNSTIPMGAGSAQMEWLRADLEANRSACTAAYWHHPLFSSGKNGNTPAVRDAWNLLYQHGVEVVLNAHDHLYERFAPQDPSGRPDAARGIRQFTVGTGGVFLYGVQRLQPNSEVQASVHGILKLTLRDGGYDWEFVTVPGSARGGDLGSASCH